MTGHMPPSEHSIDALNVRGSSVWYEHMVQIITFDVPSYKTVCGRRWSVVPLTLTSSFQQPELAQAYRGPCQCTRKTLCRLIKHVTPPFGNLAQSVVVSLETSVSLPPRVRQSLYINHGLLIKPNSIVVVRLHFDVHDGGPTHLGTKVLRRYPGIPDYTVYSCNLAGRHRLDRTCVELIR